MSDLATKTMLEAYNQSKAPSQYFTKKFNAKFFSTKSVEVDIVRTEEDVAIAVQDLSVGSRMNSADIYTNKEFIPPIFSEAVPLNVLDLLDRSPGANPFAELDFQAIAMFRLLDGITKVESKIRRAIELQASQVMQTGTATLTDATGGTIYSVDYKPKATHFPTSGTAWDQVGDNKLGDIESLADVIRGDGLTKPDVLTFGSTAWNSFINDSAVQVLLDNRRIILGGIAPQARGDEATFKGMIWIGDYEFEMWSLNSRYKNPVGGASTPFMDPVKVIVESSTGRKDLAFGAIPLIVPPSQRVLPFLPERMSNAGGGVDMFPNAWVNPEGTNLFASVGSRPIAIPVAIDTFGCLNTGL